MIIEKFDYHFKIRNSYEVAINLAAIYNDIGYKQFNKAQLNEVFKTSQQDTLKNNYLQYFNGVVEDLNKKNQQELAETLIYLNERWNEYKQTYYDIIADIFNIEFKEDAINNLYCELQYLPINEISLKDGAIYLNCNQSNEHIFIKFIVMLTKLLLLQNWEKHNSWKFNTDFEVENKIFMFADIAIDALFYNTELKRLCENPSYKYFYKLNYQNLNMMNSFRQMYSNMELNKFLDEVYLFVYKNYQSLIEFKHYLY